MDARHWLAAVSWLCQLLGSVLLLWGLKVVPVSNPFTLFVREPRPEGVGKSPVPPGITREHPWAVTWGAVLFLAGLALAVALAVHSR
jgi:hypothetical protein